MKTWAEFYDHVLPDVPDCNPAMADIALRHAAREFCEKTKAWDEWRGPEKTTATTIQMDFDISPLEEVVKLLGATLDGEDLRVRSVNDLPANWMTNSGLQGIVTIDRSSYYVVPQRAAGLSVLTRLALKPSNTGTGVSDQLFAHYVEEIATGAKARLMLSPKKPYSNLALAAVHAKDFQDATADVARKVEKSFSRNGRRVTPMYF